MSGLSFSFARECFETALSEGGYQQATIRQKMACLKVLYAYLSGQGITDLRSVDRAVMLGFIRYLGEYEGKRTGKKLQESTKKGFLTVARLLFRSLHERSLILANPMRGITFAVRETSRVRIILSEADVARFLDSIDTALPFGFRDRALFELIYSSGLRSGEASSLTVGDVDLSQRLLRVHEGKYSKDRVVPITELAAELLAEFIRSRPVDTPVFRGTSGLRLRAAAVNVRFKEIARREGLYRQGLSVHSLRHACATHLLAHGADIRYVQGLLGHKSVQTTVCYTNELLENLRRRYVRGHPRENEMRREIDESYRKAFGELASRLGKAKRKRDQRMVRATLMVPDLV